MPNYDQLKFTKDGKAYSGMQVGASHHWVYHDGSWNETKLTPDEWSFKYSATKQRANHAPDGSGASIGTEYHWMIVADQLVRKQDSDSYTTNMAGVKFKVGYKKPTWRAYSYTYPDAKRYREIVIQYLEQLLIRLRAEQGANRIYSLEGGQQ